MPAKSHQPNSTKLSEKGTKLSTSRVWGIGKNARSQNGLLWFSKNGMQPARDKAMDTIATTSEVSLPKRMVTRGPKTKEKDPLCLWKWVLIIQEERKEILSFLPWGKEESQAHTCSLLEAALATQIVLLPIPSPDNQAPLSLSLSVSVFLSVSPFLSLFLSLFLCLSSLLKSVSSFSCQDLTLLSTMKREAPHIHKYKKERRSWKVYAVEKRKNAWLLWEDNETIAELIGNHVGTDWELIENWLGTDWEPCGNRLRTDRELIGNRFGNTLYFGTEWELKGDA